MSDEEAPYFVKNVLLMHVFAQFRPESTWPPIAALFYHLHRVFIYFCFMTAVLCPALQIYLDGFNQISDVAMHILTILVYSSILVRTTIFMWRYSTVDNLIRRCNAVMRESSRFPFDACTMQRGRRYSDAALLVWMFFVLLCGLILAFSSIVKSTRELPLPMWLPYDWRADVYYHVTISVQTLTQIYMVCCYANIEMFNICNHIVLKYQFDLLGKDLKFLIPNVLHRCGMPKGDVEEYMGNPNNEKCIEMVERIRRTDDFQDAVVANLRVCIRHHQEVMFYKDEFYAFISPLLMIELNYIFTYIIFVLFTLVTTDNTAMYLALVIYCYAILMQSFIVCFVGEMLTNQVEELRTILFDVPWYYCGRRFLIDFKLIQTRLLRNDYLRAGKLLPVSLAFYLELVKKAASFLAVLRQVNDQ